MIPVNQQGFSLIEILLYIGLLSILLGAITSIFGTILDANLASKATASVDQDGRYILARLTHDVQSATASAAPVYGQPAGTTLKISGNALSYTYSIDAPNGNLILTNNMTGTADNLNSVDASVSALTFQRIGSGGSNDTIQVKFTLTSRVQRIGGVVEQKNFQTTLGLP